MKTVPTSIGNAVHTRKIKKERKQSEANSLSLYILHAARTYISLYDFLILTEYLTKLARVRLSMCVCVWAIVRHHICIYDFTCATMWWQFFFFFYSLLLVHSISISYRLATLDESQMADPTKKIQIRWLDGCLCNMVWAKHKLTRELARLHSRSRMGRRKL